MKQYLKYRHHCEEARRSNLPSNQRHCEEVRRSNLPIHFNGLLRFARNDEKPNRHCDPAIFGGRSNLFIVILLLVLLSHTTIATVITVKQDGTGNYTTIQTGINAATTGDTVLVWPGTYFENITLNQKCITIGSLFLTTNLQDYISSTIIDGNHTNNCIRITNCTDSQVIFSGFTVRNGKAFTYNRGGGFYIYTSHCRIDHCIIQNNSAHHGGGICAQNSNLFLSGSVIKRNRAIQVGGGITDISGSIITFDAIHLNSLFLNYGSQGCDFYKAIPDQPTDLVLDTFTVQLPDLFFIYSISDFGFPLNDVSFSCLNHKIDPIPADLFVDPVNGDNSNSGLSSLTPLKNIYDALIKIKPDSSEIRHIYLSSGTYSESGSSEFLPVNCRSFIEIKGASMNSTILHGEFKYPLIKVNVNSEQVSLKNMTLKKGNGSAYVGNIPPFFARTTNFLTMDSLHIVNNTSEPFSCIIFSNCDHVLLKNSVIEENYGENPIYMGNGDEVEKSFRLENCKYIDNTPDSNLITPGTTSIAILGDWVDPGLYKGEIINFLIENNTCIPDPEWGPGCGTGIGMDGYVETNFINLTLTNNIALTNESAMFNAINNAVGSFYNSIFFNDDICEICYSPASMVLPPGTTNILYSNLQGGEEAIENPGNYQIINWLEGNINEDPQWTASGDFPYSLQPGSPCINAGTPMHEEGMDYPYIKDENGKYILYMLDGDTVTLPATDLAGNPRISGGRIDMGAYEWHDTSTNITSKPISVASQISVSPNPFSSNTFISFKTDKEQLITIKVLDLKGQSIKTITQNKYPSGSYRLVWDGHDNSGFPLHSGTYLICLYSNGTLNSIIKANKINPR